jgi:PSP
MRSKPGRLSTELRDSLNLLKEQGYQRPPLLGGGNGAIRGSFFVERM